VNQQSRQGAGTVDQMPITANDMIRNASNA